jgi:hypothetical protein
MRYLDVEIRQSPAERNPMHQFLVDHDDYTVARLLARESFTDEHALVFHVEGPESPYRDALEDRDAVLQYTLDACPDGSFYLYVRERLTAGDRDFSVAFSQPGLVVVMPVAYHADGTVRVTAVGPAEAVGEAVEAVPETMGVDVLAVGEFLAGRVDGRAVTERQFEAVEAAVDAGYYGATREATLSEVASRLDCSAGTAAQLLRRAERTVMAALVADGPV